jgi:glycosyltransferase involved in cell wall biosynthesis
MRILLVNHEFTITGASTVLFRLALHLQGQAHEVSVLPANPQDGPMKARYEAQGIPVSNTADLHQFDLAICNGICTAGLVLRVAPVLPTIWFVHEAEIALNLILKNPDWIRGFALSRAVVYQTSYQHEVLGSFTFNQDRTKFHIIPNGIEVALECLARDKVAPKRHAFRAVQAGTMEPRKRPGDFIRAVKASGLDMEAVLCGKYFHIDDDALEIIKADPEKYRVLEGLSDAELLAWVESADMYCQASGSETQGIAAYEAALLSRPMLLSDLPCYRGVFRHGHNCLMYPPGSIRLLAHAMRVLASDPELRTTLGQAARVSAGRFTHARFFHGFDAVIGSVVQA